MESKSNPGIHIVDGKEIGIESITLNTKGVFDIVIVTYTSLINSLDRVTELNPLQRFEEIRLNFDILK